MFSVGSAQPTSQRSILKTDSWAPSQDQEQAWEPACSMCIPGDASAVDLRTSFEKTDPVCHQVLSDLGFPFFGLSSQAPLPVLCPSALPPASACTLLLLSPVPIRMAASSPQGRPRATCPIPLAPVPLCPHHCPCHCLCPWPRRHSSFLSLGSLLP